MGEGHGILAICGSRVHFFRGLLRARTDPARRALPFVLLVNKSPGSANAAV